jgi:hypothetical protein
MPPSPRWRRHAAAAVAVDRSGIHSSNRRRSATRDLRLQRIVGASPLKRDRRAGGSVGSRTVEPAQLRLPPVDGRVPGTGLV